VDCLRTDGDGKMEDTVPGTVWQQNTALLNRQGCISVLWVIQKEIFF